MSPYFLPVEDGRGDGRAGEDRDLFHHFLAFLISTLSRAANAQMQVDLIAGGSVV